MVMIPLIRLGTVIAIETMEESEISYILFKTMSVELTINVLPRELMITQMLEIKSSLMWGFEIYLTDMLISGSKRLVYINWIIRLNNATDRATMPMKETSVG